MQQWCNRLHIYACADLAEGMLSSHSAAERPEEKRKEAARKASLHICHPSSCDSDRRLQKLYHAKAA